MVNAIEITIGMSVALIVGLIMLNSLYNIDFMEIQTYLSDILSGNAGQEFEKIELHEFLNKALAVQSHPDGEYAMIVYVKPNSTHRQLNNTVFFDMVRQAHLCKTFQNSTESCGTTTNVVFDVPIELPRIVHIKYSLTLKKLIIQ